MTKLGRELIAALKEAIFFEKRSKLDKAIDQVFEKLNNMPKEEFQALLESHMPPKTDLEYEAETYAGGNFTLDPDFAWEDRRDAYIAGNEAMRTKIIKLLDDHIDGSDVHDPQLNDFLVATIELVKSI